MLNAKILKIFEITKYFKIYYYKKKIPTLITYYSKKCRNFKFFIYFISLPQILHLVALHQLLAL